MNEVVVGNSAESVTLKCRLKGTPLNCMVDSGAGCSLLTKEVLEKIPNTTLTAPDMILKDASQNVINLLGKTTLPVTIAGDKGKVLKRDVTFYVSASSGSKCLLLGRDFMKSFGSVTFDFDNNSIKLGDTRCTGLRMNGGRAKVAETTCVPANSEKFVKMKWRQGSGLVRADFNPDLHNGNTGLYAMKSRVVPDAHGNFFIAVINTTKEEIILRKDGRLGKLSACAETVATVDFEEVGGNGIDWSNVKIGDVPDDDRAKIMKLLREYEDVFAKNAKKPKRVNNATHSINTGGSLPVFRKPYPIPYAHTDEFDKQVKQMLDNDIIRFKKSHPKRHFDIHSCPLEKKGDHTNLSKAKS